MVWLIRDRFKFNLKIWLVHVVSEKLQLVSVRLRLAPIIIIFLQWYDIGTMLLKQKKYTLSYWNKYHSQYFKLFLCATASLTEQKFHFLCPFCPRNAKGVETVPSLPLDPQARSIDNNPNIKRRKKQAC